MALVVLAPPTLLVATALVGGLLKDVVLPLLEDAGEFLETLCTPYFWLWEKLTSPFRR